VELNAESMPPRSGKSGNRFACDSLPREAGAMDDDTLGMLAADLRKRTEALQSMISQRVGCDEVLEKLSELRQRLQRLPVAKEKTDQK